MKQEKKSKHLWSLMLILTMAIAMMIGMTVTANATNGYEDLKNTDTVVKFDGKDWYLIECRDSYVTLLSKECVAASVFGSNNTYTGSAVETTVNNWYEYNITAGAKTAVSYDKMFLLSKGTAETLNPDVRKCSLADGASYNAWWLNSPGSTTTSYVMSVLGSDGSFYEYPAGETTLGVRPALSLLLTNVVFDSDTNTFLLAYPLWVGGTHVTSVNMDDVFGDGKVSYIPASGETPAKLKLNNYSYTGAGYFDVLGGTSVILSLDPLTIELTGTNTLINTVDDALSNAIDCAFCDLTITGSGTLTANSSDTSGRWSIGIYAGQITIDSGATVKATGGRAGTESEGIYAGGLTVKGTLEAKGDLGTTNSYGVRIEEDEEFGTSVDVVSGSTLTAVGSTKAINGKVKNAIAGTGWSNTEGTGEGTAIPISTKEQNLSSYKKVQFPEKVNPAPTPVSVTVNSKTVSAKSLSAAVAKAGTTKGKVKTIVLGKKVKKISKGAFKNFKKARTLVVKTKKLKKATVRNSLKGSRITKVKVKVGKKKVNKKYVKKYKKIFTKKNAGKKVKVTL